MWTSFRALLPDGRHRHPEQMMRGRAAAGGPRYGRGASAGHRWGATKGKIGFHGGKVDVRRPRVRCRDGDEVALPSWETAMAEDWLGHWAINLMLINVSTRRSGAPSGCRRAMFRRSWATACRNRRCHAGSWRCRPSAWQSGWRSDLSKLDLLVIQIDGLHIEEDLILLAAVGIDGAGDKHPLGVIEGATENAAVVQALLDNLVDRGLDPKSAASSSSMAPRR